MHPALPGIALRTVRSGGLIDQSLLHDRAVHREAVRRGFGGLGGGSSGDEGFKDSVLASLVVRFGFGRVVRTTYDDLRVPFADVGVLVLCRVVQGAIAGLCCCEQGGSGAWAVLYVPRW